MIHFPVALAASPPVQPENEGFWAASPPQTPPSESHSCISFFALCERKKRNTKEQKYHAAVRPERSRRAG
jgi:hypothetical protein